MRRTVFGYAAFLVLLVSVGFSVPRVVQAQDVSSSNYQILAPVIASGGGYATSTNFSVLGVISEFSHNLSSSDTTYNLIPGFAAYPFVSTPIVTATGVTTAVNLSWTAAVGVLGYSTASYSIGQSTASGGPYAFTAIGNILSSTVSSLTAGQPYYFIIRAHDSYSTTIATSTQATATPTAPAAPPSSGGGGGGGGGISPISNTNINFSGRAYPRSSVTFLKDAQVAATTVAGADAQFSISLSNLTGGNYVFAVYAEDKDGNRSSLLTFPVAVTTGATTNVSGIFLAPTLSADKSEVKRGDSVTFFGQSVPQSDIIISVNSAEEFFSRTVSDKNGVYLYNFDTTVLDYGSHTAKSKSSIGNELISSFSAVAAFKVGTQNVAAVKTIKCSIRSDLNADCKVNLIDFSVMAYWYQRTLSGNGFNADLNHDNKVNLTDFSILASNWTG